MKNNTYSILHDFMIKASKNAVYNAITQPEHLNNWWPLNSSGTPEVGATYNLNFTADYDWYGEVVICETNKSFFIRMTKSDDDWNNTIFGFYLEEVNEDVIVKFQHTNWKACNDEFKQSSFCWAMLLNALKNYVEKDQIIPFDKRQ